MTVCVFILVAYCGLCKFFVVVIALSEIAASVECDMNHRIEHFPLLSNFETTFPGIGSVFKRTAGTTPAIGNAHIVPEMRKLYVEILR